MHLMCGFVLFSSIFTWIENLERPLKMYAKPDTRSPNRKGIQSPSPLPFIEIHGSAKYYNKYKESGNFLVPQ